jgi:tetratricopeptide (TPR) repeat protein
MEKADPFFYSLLYQINRFNLLKININKQNNNSSVHESDFNLYISRIKDLDDMVLFLCLESSLTKEILWSEKCYYKDSYGSYIKWMDKTTEQIGIIIGSDIGIIQKKIIESYQNEQSFYNQAISSFKRIFHVNYKEEYINEAFEMTEKALDVYPFDKILLGNYSSLCSIKSFLDNKGNDQLLAKSEDFLSQIKILNPDNPIIQLSSLRNLCARGKLKELREGTNKILNSSGQSYTSLLVALGFNILTSAEPEKEVKEFQNIIRLSPYYPAYAHVYLYLYHYSRKNYTEALNELRKMPQTDAGYYDLGLLSLLGNLNRIEEAQVLLKRIRQTSPAFEINPYRFYPSITQETGVVESVVRGLKKIL